MTVERKAWWVGGAAVAAALAIWSLRGDPPRALAPAPEARAPVAREAPADAPADVRLDALAGDARVPGQLRRNPFRFATRATSPVAGGGVFAPPPSAGPVPLVGAPGSPATALKFIGIVESASGMKLAVLSDGRVVSHGQEGDIIEGQYRILKIGVESIELVHVDGRGRQTLRLTGQ